MQTPNALKCALPGLSLCGALPHHWFAMQGIALRVALGLAATAAVGCAPTGSNPPPGSSTPTAARGHVHGTVTLSAGPVPACTNQSPCPTVYTHAVRQATITAARSDGTIVAKTTTNSAGGFDVELPAGTYTVATPQQSEPGRYSAQVTVHPRATVDVSLEVTEP